MTLDHERAVAGQFGPQAQAYVTSAVHAAGADLDWMAAQLDGAAAAELIDLGCGGGHVGYRAAASVRAVTACDLSADMLRAVESTARERGLSNLRTQQASVERLPFPDGAFDIAATRFSAHHWTGFEGGLREAARVLKPDGLLLVVDGCSPGEPLRDTYLQAIELLRDPSHVRDYGLAEWAGALARSGFLVEEVRTSRVWLEFDSWIARMRTPEAAVVAIRRPDVRPPFAGIRKASGITGKSAPAGCYRSPMFATIRVARWGKCWDGSGWLGRPRGSRHGPSRRSRSRAVIPMATASTSSSTRAGPSAGCSCSVGAAS